MTSLDTPYQTLFLEERAPGVVTVTLNRPDRFNAMTAVMFDELEQMAAFLGDEDDLRVVILTGRARPSASATTSPTPTSSGPSA